MSPNATSPSGSGRKSTCHSPPDVFDRRRLARDPIEVFPVAGAPVQLLELLGERPRGLLLQHRHDALDPREFVGVQVHDVAARRERRVLERLQVAPHVGDDGVDQIACGSP